MAWETRARGGRYYYQKVREGGRVRSVYLGSGLHGQFSAMMDAEGRKEKEATRAASRREIKKQNQIDARIDEICALIEKLVTAASIASGYRQHKRQWRRKRNEKDDSKVS
ncbi:MAG TPA: hypothetical protein VJT09_04615 [Pyrinomonadaceae bacterium]|nr:hypothetical protein [Pyrinomonadaceae bacterium]